MTSTFAEIQDAASQLKADQGNRTAMMDEMDRMIFMDPANKAQLRNVADNAKVTLSSEPRDQFMGALRLLTASDPIFKISLKDQDTAASLKKIASGMWNKSGMISGIPIHYDLIWSALAYAEVHFGIVSLTRLAKLSVGKPIEKLAKQSLLETPYMFEVYPPRQCYARYSKLGLVEHLRETPTTARRVLMDWGDAAKKALGDRKGNDPVILSEWWDLEYNTVWIGGSGNIPIQHEQYDLPFLPIISGITEGSPALYDKPDQQRMPFLYAVAKSGMWQRQNLALTVLFTMVNAIGGNPMFVYKANAPGKQLQLDFSRPGGTATIEANEDLYPLQKNVIDPSVREALQVASDAVVDQTMYKQALGQSVNQNAPYSTIALLSQSGRLPLTSPKMRLGWLIARASWMALQWMKNEKATQSFADLDFDSIPDTLDLQAQLEVALPQDKLNMANVAKLLVESGFVTEEWARENILQIGQDEDMGKQVVRAQFLKYLVQQWLTQQQQQEQQDAQAQAQADAAAQQGQQGPGPGPGTAGGLPPGMAQAGQQGPQPVPGQSPAQAGPPGGPGGLPPEIAAQLGGGGNGPQY